MPDRVDTLGTFLTLSSELTGFTQFRLTGTGMAGEYLQAATSVVGDDVVRALLEAYIRLPDTDTGQREAAMRATILSDELLGPIARNIIKMWYVGTWYELPTAWREAFGAHDRDSTFVVSPVAYTESLLWPAVDANPPGAKGPGYGTWAYPPQIPARGE